MEDLNQNQGSELIAYIGQEIKSLLKVGYSPSQVKHLVSSNLIECIMKTVALKQDNQYEYYALKPLFIALKYLVDMEISKEAAEEYSYLPQIQADIAELERISRYLDKKISLIKEEEV